MEDKEANENLPSTINTQELDKSNECIARELIKETDSAKSKQLIDLFNVNIAKKNMIRTLKLSKLLDIIDDEALRRILERPDTITTKELMEYMTLVQGAIDKSQGAVSIVENTSPTIKWNQQNNTTININTDKEVGGLNRESRTKVLNFIQGILKAAKTQSDTDNVIDVTDVSNEGDDTQNGN